MELLSLPMATRSSSYTSVQSAASGSSQAVDKPVKRRTWTAEEDAALREAIQLHGSHTGPGSAWPAISRHVSLLGGRSNKRWFHTLDPGLKKGKWTRDEDAALRKAFEEVGACWSEMGESIGDGADASATSTGTDRRAGGEAVAGCTFSRPESSRPLDGRGRHPALASLQRARPKVDSHLRLIPHAERHRHPKPLPLAAKEQYSVSPLTEATSSSSALTTSGDTPFFPDNDAVHHSGGDEMAFLQHILNPNHNVPSMSFDHHSQELFPDAEDTQDQSWFDAFCAAHPLPTGHSFHPGDASNHHTFPSWLDQSAPTSWFDNHSSTDPLQPPPPATSDGSAASTSTADTSGPISNVWGLLVALEGGKETVHVSAGLIRQLLSDAAKKGA